MKEKENQTPRKEHPRTSDLANRRSIKDSPAKKTSKKIAPKCLTEAFASPVTDVLPEISEESSDFTSISEISDVNYNGETDECFVMASYPSLSTSTETFTPSVLTPCSKITIANGDKQIDFSKIGSAEVEIVVNLLNQARLQALNSVDMENKSKKVLDELIKLIINELYSFPQERDELPQLNSRNAYVGFLCFLLWIVAVVLLSFYLFSYLRLPRSFTRLPPT